MSDPTLDQGRVGMVKIRYIGAKPKKTDNICNTDTVWSAFGDVQEVPPLVAQKLLVTKYRNIWQLASDRAPEQNPMAARVANAQDATTAARAKLALRAASKGPSPDKFDKVSLEDIVDAVSELAESKDTTVFGDDGLPKLEAVDAKLGKSIGQAALNEAWAFIMSARA